MPTDVSNLEAGRETDAAVARALGWTECGHDTHPYRSVKQYLGRDPRRSDAWCVVPPYSTTDAALTALEDWQDKGGYQVLIDRDPKTKLWHASLCGESIKADFRSFDAPTLYLAICRLIVASGKGSP